MMVWKMIFLFQGCLLRFHVNLPGYTFFRFGDVGVLVGRTELSMPVSLANYKTPNRTPKTANKFLVTFHHHRQVSAGFAHTACVTDSLGDTVLVRALPSWIKGHVKPPNDEFSH